VHRERALQFLPAHPHQRLGVREPRIAVRRLHHAVDAVALRRARSQNRFYLPTTITRQPERARREQIAIGRAIQREHLWFGCTELERRDPPPIAIDPGQLAPELHDQVAPRVTLHRGRHGRSRFDRRRRIGPHPP
jgi:hypothetical protein